MAVKQTIWSLDEKIELLPSELDSERELEDLLCEHLEIIDPNLLFIGHQITTEGGPLDILCLDGDQNTIIIELKKDRTPRDVTAQIMDYASCISKYTYQTLYEKCKDGGIEIDKAFFDKYGYELEPESENGFNSSTRMIIVAASMDSSTERIVNYLNEMGIDINILFFSVFEIDGKRLLSRAWMIDEEQMPVKSKKISEWNGEYYCVFEESPGERVWDDAVKYGFFSAGGGSRYSQPLYKLEPNSKIWLHIAGNGYCGYGEVIGTAMPADKAILPYNGKETEFLKLPGLKGHYRADDPEKIEHIVPVRWIKTVKPKGIWMKGFFGNQNIVSMPRSEKWEFTVRQLRQAWNLDKL